MAQTVKRLVGPAVRHWLAINTHLDPNTIPASGPRGLLKGDLLSFLKTHPAPPASSSIASSSPVTPTLTSTSSPSFTSSSTPSSSSISSSSTSPSASPPSPPPSSRPASSASSPASTPLKSPAGYTDLPTNNIRKVIANRLSESKRTIPHEYSEIRCKVDGLLALRKKVNSELEARSQKGTSINDWFIKAAALALLQVPEVNVTYNAQTSEVVHYGVADISLAVAIPDGLITPIIRDAGSKGVATISEEVRLLVDKARAGKLLPQEFQGGTFTISNLGMFGISSFRAVINPPQAAILAVGGTVQRINADESGKLRHDSYVSFSLSYDVRAIDGESASAFLQSLDTLLQNPLAILGALPVSPPNRLIE